MSPSESPQFLSQRDQAPTSTFFPVSDSFNSLSSKLTSSDKLSELPVATPNRIMRSQNARAIRRSLDSLPPSSSGDSAPSPRITQAWSTIPARSSLDTPQQRVSFENDTPQALVCWLSPPQRERPFVPINPFEFTRAGFYSCFGLSSTTSDDSSIKHATTFITDTLPRQVYLHLLLRLPSMYFSRVARIFEDAEVSRPDIERMIDAGMGGDVVELATSGRESMASFRTPTPNMVHIPLPVPDEWTSAVVSPALVRFKHSWEDFVVSLIKEWKTLNVVSALLLSAILTMFQIPPAASDPVTRTTALLSLVSALMSLCYGCVYIVRFSTMGSMYRASKFAEEARRTNTLIWWNVWTLLSMPAVFLAWSVVFFIVSIMSFVWRTGSVLAPEERQSLGPQAILGPRVAITVVLLLGLLYFALIIVTLRRYGEPPARNVEAQTGPRGRTAERTPSRRKMRSTGRRDRTDAGVEKDADSAAVADGQPPSPALPSSGMDGFRKKSMDPV
ncbi:hypothetical protein B0H14DRAFT_2697945 [Mycena olivaceomarginata]|nr:hypothetical protein B0H14DRAFT_2697945 [Mycena olivaceomarginata]